VPKAIERALAKDVAMLRCLAGLAAMDAGVEASEWAAGKFFCKQARKVHKTIRQIKPILM
jgi:hypothetical protein